MVSVHGGCGPANWLLPGRAAATDPTARLPLTLAPPHLPPFRTHPRPAPPGLSAYWSGVSPTAPGVAKYQPRLYFPKPTPGLSEIEPRWGWGACAGACV